MSVDVRILIFKTKQITKKDGELNICKFHRLNFTSENDEKDLLAPTSVSSKDTRQDLNSVKAFGILTQPLRPSAWVPQLQRGNLAAIRMLLD